MPIAIFEQTDKEWIAYFLYSDVSPAAASGASLDEVKGQLIAESEISPNTITWVDANPELPGGLTYVSGMIKPDPKGFLIFESPSAQDGSFLWLAPKFLQKRIWRMRGETTRELSGVTGWIGKHPESNELHWFDQTKIDQSRMTQMGFYRAY